MAGGGAAFTDFQRSELTASRLDASGEVSEQDFSRRIGAHTTGTIAGWLGYWPASTWGLRVYGSFTPTRFQTIISRSAAEFIGVDRLNPDTTQFASLSIAAVQLQAVFRFPVIHGKVMPYGVVGGGTVRYSVPDGSEPVPVEAGTDLGPGTRQQFAGTFGAGAMLQTRRTGWTINFELMDKLSRTPIRSGPVRVLNAASFTIGLSWHLSGH